MSARLSDEERLARKKARDRAYYLANRDKLIAYANEYGPRWRKEHPEANNAINKRHRLKVRLAAITAYGGKCSCCGESNLAFLSIDHVNENGAQHRRDNKLGTAGFPVYRWLKANGWPEGFQVLCYNCNLGRSFHGGGVCPHLTSPDSLSLLST